MPKAKNPNLLFSEIFPTVPVDTAAMEDAFKFATALNEKLAASALKAVSSAQVVAEEWTQDALAQAAELSKAKAEPADYLKAATDIATKQSEAAVKTVASYADIAKACQTETMELLSKAGKELNEDAAKTVKAATETATKAAKKLAAAA